jgi:hypothetical protein
MFKEQVCRPVQDIIEKRLQPLFKEKTNAFHFRLEELTLTDEETSSRIRERELRWDVITPNEVRDMKGMPPLDGADERVGLMSQSSARRAPNSAPVQSANESRQSDTRASNESGGPNQTNSDQTTNVPGEGGRRE